MSKGYGKCQRLIIDKLASRGQEDYFHLVDLLPARHSKAQYQSMSRAARTLEAAGKIKISYAGGVVIHHTGTVIDLVPNPLQGKNTDTGYYYPPMIHKVSVYLEQNGTRYTLMTQRIPNKGAVKIEGNLPLRHSVLTGSKQRDVFNER